MEVHAELLTESKMFCRCQVGFGGEANTRVCPICLGLPGTLPVPNRRAIELVIKTSLALNCTIAMRSIFHRKNYFYPDLPKGFQVSQYGETNPLGYKGWLEIPAAGGGFKRIGIRRVHLEEDTGKLMHLPGGGSGVDYNRAGVPLMEVVTDFPPDITNPEEAKEYLVQLRQILLYLGVCDGRMEEGSMRCEPNISVRPEGAEKLGVKTELKNLNSYRAVQLGTQYEMHRQVALLEKGERVLQETRGWNEGSESSFAMRVKEEENDYRYFPCPDLVPMQFDEPTIERIRSEIPELPLAKVRRYQDDFGLNSYDANLLTSDQSWAKFFEDAVSQGANPKLACNWMNSDFVKLLNESGQWVDGERVRTKVTPAHLVDLINLIEKATISGKMAKAVFDEMFESGAMPSKVVEAKGLSQLSDSSAIEGIVQTVINNNAEVVANYKAGKQGVLGFLVGQVMKESQGRANPTMVQELLRKNLGS